MQRTRAGAVSVSSTRVGYRLVVEVASALRDQGRRLAVICAPGRLRRTLTLAGLDGHLAIFPDRATAHRSS